MSKGFIKALLVVVPIVVTAVGFGLTYATYANQGNRMDVAINAKHKNLENVLSSGYQQISGVAQVAEIAKDDLKEAFTEAITAREGEDGSRAVFKVVTESNPNVDSNLYREIQRVVQATKKEYQTEQTAFIVQKAQYQEALGTVWGGWWLKFAGYPKTNLADLKIVTTGKASRAIETGVEEEISIRPKK